MLNMEVGLREVDEAEQWVLVVAGVCIADDMFGSFKGSGVGTGESRSRQKMPGLPSRRGMREPSCPQSTRTPPAGPGFVDGVGKEITNVVVSQRFCQSDTLLGGTYG